MIWKAVHHFSGKQRVIQSLDISRCWWIFSCQTVKVKDGPLQNPSGFLREHGIFRILVQLFVLRYTPWNLSLPPENSPSEKETSIPTIHFQVLLLLVSERALRFWSKTCEPLRTLTLDCQIDCKKRPLCVLFTLATPSKNSGSPPKTDGLQMILSWNFCGVY